MDDDDVGLQWWLSRSVTLRGFFILLEVQNLILSSGDPFNHPTTLRLLLLLYREGEDAENPIERGKVWFL
jgi:hypothetical protein